MGASKSKNVANAIANVSNFVSNSTTADSSQANDLTQTIQTNGCIIKLRGDFDVKASGDLMQTNNQIITAKQNTGVSNSIQQQMLQQAQSTVGAMGIGYADASNTANSMTSVTTDIQQQMTAAARQYANTSQTFQCNNSTIEANNLNINFSNNADFLSTQTLNNDQTSNIVNNITQTISQKATATVEGITGVLLAIALIAAVFVYGVTKPLSSGGAKVAISVVLLFILAIIISGMYLASAPPFFQEPDYCLGNMDGFACGGSSCIDQQMSSFRLKAPPLKYSYNLIPMSGTGVNFLAMIVTYFAIGQQNQTGGTVAGAGDNGGYRLDVMDSIQSAVNTILSGSDFVGAPNLKQLMGLSADIDLPPILINPHPTPNTAYQIPDEYKVNGTGGNSSPCNGANCTAMGRCTPSILQLNLDPNCVATANFRFDCFSPVCPKDLPNNGAGTPLTATSQRKDFLAQLNVQGWTNYLTPPSGSASPDILRKRAFLARFVLSRLVTPTPLDENVYIFSGEPVVYNTPAGRVVSIASNAPADSVYQFVPDSTNQGPHLSYSGSGTMVGLIGKCNNAKYKFSKFMSKIGGYILLGILALLFIYMLYSYKTNNVGGGVEKGGEVVSEPSVQG